ncbi:MAG: DUF1223 domain-containing protein [Bacteroidota bacterium]
MNKVVGALALVFLVGWALMGVSPNYQVGPLEEEVVAEPKGIVIMELFTSEGCSSCPPADRLLIQTMEEALTKGLPVYGLSFHVDYWNYLGWKDPYSQKAFSDRQRAYARRLGNGGPYTPQMVVNGKREFVGSRQGEASMAMQAGLEEAALHQLQLSMRPHLAKDSLKIAWEVTGETDHQVLNLALTESKLSQHINRGENRGRTLTHDHVVRNFRSVRLDKSGRGEVVLALPPGLKKAHSRVIGYVQKLGLGKISGAAALPLEP